MEIRFQVAGDVQVQRTLVGVADRGENISPAFEALHESFLGIERRQFESEGGLGSGGWAPLKPSTLRAKAAKGQDQRILRATNALMNSLIDLGNANHEARIDRDSFFFGTRDPKARYHQRGTSKMPRRRPVELTERQRRAWMKTIQRYLVSGEVLEGEEAVNL